MIQFYPLYIFVFVASVIFLFYLKRSSRVVVEPVIAGNVNVPIDEKHLRDKELFLLNNFICGDKIIPINKSAKIYYLSGNSLKLFGLHDQQKILATPINNITSDVKRGDILILRTQTEQNKDRLKSRVCLGFWGDPDKPDEDLIHYENYEGTVRSYFREESPKRYNYPEPYAGPIKGYLKTLSCDQDTARKKISRPHDPELAVGKVDYIFAD